MSVARRIGPGHDIAVLVERELALEQFGHRRVADGDEDAVAGELAALAGLDVAQAHARDMRRRCRSPRISSTTLSQITRIFGLANSRACRIFSARKPVAAMDQRHAARRDG